MADDAKDESVLFLPEVAAGEGEMLSAETLDEGTAGGAGVAFLGAFACVLTSISQPTQYISPALLACCQAAAACQQQCVRRLSSWSRVCIRA